MGGVSVEANNEAVAALAGLKPDDILWAAWRNAAMRPCEACLSSFIASTCWGMAFHVAQKETRGTAILHRWNFLAIAQAIQLIPPPSAGHYVAIDRTYNVVVVGIRGSLQVC